MTIPVALAVLLGSLPAGFIAAVATQRLADGTRPSVFAMVVACAVLGIWATPIVPTLSLLAISLALGWALLVLAAVDAIAFRLPDIVTLPLIVVGLVVAWWLPGHDLVGHVIGVLIALLLFYAVAVVYQRVRHQEGLGLGDVKLAGAAGAWLGWQALPYVVLLACALGLVWVGVAIMRRGREAVQERIPFGIALCFAIWVIWLYGPPELFGPLS
jgi:leader peptidase (prepilin peptidase)/N-methyltransferase